MICWINHILVTGFDRELHHWPQRHVEHLSEGGFGCPARVSWNVSWHWPLLSNPWVLLLTTIIRK
jgi:hypothetical protein